MGQTLATYPSSSDPNKEYRIIKGADGKIYCDCTGWKMRKDCKHLRDYLANTGGAQPAQPQAAIQPKKTAKSTTADMPTTVNQSEFTADEFQSRKWYQGCGGLIEGDSGEIIATLAIMEKKKTHVAEPKYDGIWVAAFSDGESVRFWSRNQNEKPYGLNSWKLPAGALLIGELGFGSEFALERRNKYGHDFMDVFGILYEDYTCLANLDESERRFKLEAFMDKLDNKTREHFRLAPRYTNDFALRFKEEHEGLVLKLASGPTSIYTGCGQKVGHWVKAKKWAEADMVVMDITISKAVTKTNTPMTEAIICGQYVNGVLKPLVRVGSMTSQWSEEFAKNFSAYKGKVMRIAHFGQFKSGSLRHPSMIDLRDDKYPADCVFDPEAGDKE